LEYAIVHNIKLEINKKNKYGWSPLHLLIENNDTEIFKLLIEYANKQNIILEIDENKPYGESPILTFGIKNKPLG